MRGERGRACGYGGSARPEPRGAGRCPRRCTRCRRRRRTAATWRRWRRGALASCSCPSSRLAERRDQGKGGDCEREGGKEGRREGGREGGRAGGREGGRVGGRERGGEGRGRGEGRKESEGGSRPCSRCASRRARTRSLAPPGQLSYTKSAERTRIPAEQISAGADGRGSSRTSAGKSAVGGAGSPSAGHHRYCRISRRGQEHERVCVCACWGGGGG